MSSGDAAITDGIDVSCRRNQFTGCIKQHLRIQRWLRSNGDKQCLRQQYFRYIDCSGVVVVDEAYGQFADFTALDLLGAGDPSESLIVPKL